MKGIIRTNEKCPRCGKSFSLIKKMGLWCFECKTHPHRFFVDIFVDGKRRKIYVDKHGKVLDSYRSAEDLLSAINQDMENKKLDIDKYKLAEYRKYQLDNFIDLFLDEKEKNNLAPSYLKEIRRHCKIFSTFFYGWDIRNIKTIDIARFKNYLTQKTTTQRFIMTTVKTIFLDAQRKELLDRIPTFPKFNMEEPKWSWIDSDTQSKILFYIPEPNYEAFKFLFLHGCRPSELRALKVKDIDLKNNYITIQRTFSLNELRESTKQGRINVIPIHPECYEHIRYVCSNSLPEAFVFPNPRTGKPYIEDCLRRIWRGACRKAGIKVKLYNASRHSFASQLVNNNTPIEIVSKLLGHSSIKMTQKYAHVNLSSQLQAMQKLSVNRPSFKNENKKTLIN